MPIKRKAPKNLKDIKHNYNVKNPRVRVEL